MLKWIHTNFNVPSSPLIVSKYYCDHLVPVNIQYGSSGENQSPTTRTFRFRLQVYSCSLFDDGDIPWNWLSSGGEFALGRWVGAMQQFVALPRSTGTTSKSILECVHEETPRLHIYMVGAKAPFLLQSTGGGILYVSYADHLISRKADKKASASLQNKQIPDRRARLPRKGRNGEWWLAKG